MNSVLHNFDYAEDIKQIEQHFKYFYKFTTGICCKLVYKNEIFNMSEEDFLDNILENTIIDDLIGMKNQKNLVNCKNLILDNEKLFLDNCCIYNNKIVLEYYDYRYYYAEKKWNHFDFRSSQQTSSYGNYCYFWWWSFGS